MTSRKTLRLGATGFLTVTFVTACATTPLPSKSDLTTLETIGTAPGPVYIVNSLSDDDKRIVKEAHAAMITVLNSDAFKTKMNAKKLRAGCLNDVKVTGDFVIADIQERTIPVILRKQNSTNANATTDIVDEWMRIDHNRFNNWDKSKQNQAAMVNTLVHETTHLVPYDNATPPGKNWFYKYYDQGHNTNSCMDADLVSYVTGNLAGEVWLNMP